MQTNEEGARPLPLILFFSRPIYRAPLLNGLAGVEGRSKRLPECIRS